MAQFEISLTHNIREVRRSLKTYEKRQLPTAVQRALNKTLDFAFTTTHKVMRKHIGMTRAEIIRRMRKIKAPPQGDTAILRIKSQKVPNLASFPHDKPQKSIKGKRRLARKGVSARVYERRKTYRGTFIWERGTSETVFKRKRGAAKVVPRKRLGGEGSIRKAIRGGNYKGGFIKKGEPLKRQPIEAVWGADLTQVYIKGTKRGTSPKRKITVAIRREFPKKLRHEISRIRRR
jgi:hypothetical protein